MIFWALRIENRARLTHFWHKYGIFFYKCGKWYFYILASSDNPFCSWNVHNMKFYTLYLVWNIDQLCPIDIVHFRVCIVLVSAKLLGGTIDGYRAVSSHNLTTKHRVFSLWPSLTKWRSAEKLHPSWSNTCSIVPAKKNMGSDADSLPPDTREMLTAVFRCQ